jgi:hypothetical protein
MPTLRNRVYFRLKPLIPQSLRTALRRRVALRLRGSVDNIWPIMPGSERSPEDWPGWPGGKKFALILTHDVEEQIGLDKCRELMRLERKLGFRSSFNFIPEGDYAVPRKLRDELTQNGFEVGIHDLNHDGRLFASRREFSQRATRINRYLAEWQAVGFRSAFMLHELDWLHELDIQYDASTFDTDPFEPQPEGRHTIFPVWIPRPASLNSQLLVAPKPDEGGSNRDSSSPGYVELPYTLPQDSTLFLLFREPTIAIWCKKLDWIAKHGGMALVNVHPDYLCFDRKVPKRREYPFVYYESFLEYVSREYQGVFWNATPREVAQFYVQGPASDRNRGRRPGLSATSFGTLQEDPVGKP